MKSSGGGRASTVRPSLCSLALCAGLLFFLLAAPTAQAAPKPTLLGTNPASPGASSTPRIRGDADGVVTSVFIPHGGGPVARVQEGEEGTVTIYTNFKCEGTVAATGTTGELEGAGILVSSPLPPDSETTFFATETDLAGTSPCSNGVVYQQVTTPPAPPVFGAVTPTSPANENFPRLSGSSATNSIVFLYANATCSNAPLASGTAAAFASNGIQVQVPDNSTTTFHALATLAGVSSGCSTSSISYQEVTPPDEGPPPSSNGPGVPPPVPRLRTVPGGIANDPTPIVTGSAPEAVLVKIYGGGDCEGAVLAKVSAGQFAAGVPLQIVPNTTVAFSARSVDADGDQSTCSSTVIYTDDSIAPRTRITAGPGLKTLKRTVVFRFADVTGGNDTRFLCKVDRRRWKACQTPLRLSRLGHRRHLLRVKAYDAAGNHEKRGTRRSFQVVNG